MSVQDGEDACARKTVERLLADAKLLIADLQGAVRRQPLLAIGVAAAVGLVLGALRRR